MRQVASPRECQHFPVDLRNPDIRSVELLLNNNQVVLVSGLFVANSFLPFWATVVSRPHARSWKVGDAAVVLAAERLGVLRFHVSFPLQSRRSKDAEPIIPADSAQETREAAEFKR